MIISRKIQIASALAMSAVCIFLAVFYATYIAAFAFFIGWFVFFRLEAAENKLPDDYRLVQHLCGLAAWCVIGLMVGAGTWTRPQEARGARVFESCVVKGMPGKCEEALEKIYGRSLVPLSMAISSSVNWRNTVASCRAKPDFTQCIKELTQVSDGTSVSITRDDVTRMCNGADRAQCFGDLQKSGLVYSNLAIDEASVVSQKD